MLNEKNKKLCAEVIKKYGTGKQTVKIAEECAELIQAIAKLMGGNRSREVWINYAEELVDVIVMTEQAKQMLSMTDEEVNELAEYKLVKALGKEELPFTTD